MAPSGGSSSTLQYGQRMKNSLLNMLVLLVVLALLQDHGTSAAAIAKREYVMDLAVDCYLTQGFVDVPRDRVTYATVRPASSSFIQPCTLQFVPQTDGDTLRIWMQKNAFIEDCDVSLSVGMLNGKNFVFGCRSKVELDEMKAVNGKGKLVFKRGNLDSKSYAFTVGIQAVRTQDPAGAGDSSVGDVGLIVGIIAAAVVAIVLLLVLCVCCYRKKKRDRDFRVQGAEKSQPNVAFENGKMKPEFQNYENGSPSSEKKLLVKNTSRTSSDYDAEDGRKPKSALDRFGPTPARRSDRPQGRSEQSNEGFMRDRSVEKTRDGSEDPQRSPILDALRKNPKFRRSFHENEVDADDRAKKVSGSAASSVSYNSNGVQLPPELPPVPRSPQRSPSPQRRGEKIAAIFRSRPSSSSSEIARQLEGDQEGNSGDDSPSEFVPSPHGKDKKGDTRHVLRPNRDERKSRPDERRRIEEEDDNEEERRRKRREKDRREEERERKRRQEEEEEEREEEKRRKKKERERKRRQEEEEEEEDRRERRRMEREREKEDDRLEGRFKKSASGRKSKGKGRKGRSKSTSNALDEMEDNYQRSRSKSPSSVRSLNFIEDDDDDDLDSNYMPFRRAGSKQSLYASRSSLYGRRRKGSQGDAMSMSSYAYDDMDSRYGDFDKKSLSRRDKDKMFKSTGELEMHGATAQVVRECATQTDSSKGVYVYGRKTLAKNRPGKMYSRGCQTGTGRSRRDSVGSARSGRSSRMRKAKSQESLRKRSRSRNLDESFDSSDDRRSGRSRRSRSRHLDDSFDSSDDRRSRRSNKHHRSKSRGLDDDDDEDRQSSKGKHKPRARPRKSTGTASVDLSDSDDGRSIAASTVAPSFVAPVGPNPYGPQYVPVMYPPPPGMAYIPPGAPGGPPLPPGVARPQLPPTAGPKPPIAPKPKKSKWDQLAEMADSEKQRQRHRPDSPTESMATSVYSHHLPVNGAYQPNYYAPPSYNTAQKYPDPNSTISSAYPDSSGMPLSAGRGPPRHYSYAPSESEI